MEKTTGTFNRCHLNETGDIEKMIFMLPAVDLPVMMAGLLRVLSMLTVECSQLLLMHPGARPQALPAALADDVPVEVDADGNNEDKSEESIKAKSPYTCKSFVETRPAKRKTPSIMTEGEADVTRPAEWNHPARLKSRLMRTMRNRCETERRQEENMIGKLLNKRRARTFRHTTAGGNRGKRQTDMSVIAGVMKCLHFATPNSWPIRKMRHVWKA